MISSLILSLFKVSNCTSLISFILFPKALLYSKELIILSVAFLIFLFINSFIDWILFIKYWCQWFNTITDSLIIILGIISSKAI